MRCNEAMVPCLLEVGMIILYFSFQRLYAQEPLHKVVGRSLCCRNSNSFDLVCKVIFCRQDSDILFHTAHIFIVSRVPKVWHKQKGVSCRYPPTQLLPPSFIQSPPNLGLPINRGVRASELPAYGADVDAAG